MFCNDFAWGVASSAYQTEGTDVNDGRGKCIWDAFSTEGPGTKGQNAFVTCDHMHHYKEDFALMKELGIQSYRFSINWSRLIPEGTGEVNQKAVALYRDMIQEMLKNNIKPYLTLYHWELPQALEDKGGWTNPDIVEAFGEYAKVVAENFTDLVEYIFTINEPQCFVGLGYVTGVHAPGKKLSKKETFLASVNALKAHGTAVKKLREYAKQPIKVGYAPTCTIALPATNSEADIEAAKKVFFSMSDTADNWAWNVAWFADPVMLGEFPKQGMELFKEYVPEITEEDIKLISQPIDFLGLNIYNGYYIKAGANGEPEGVPMKTGYPETAVNWPIQAECLYWGTRFCYERYGLPIYITENGMACHDAVSLDGKVHDPNRQDFLDRYISALQQAADEGVDIRGYFLWTFLDNFEWDQGYHGRFGLVHVDFETQERIPKDSAYWYKEVIETHGRILHINK